MTKKRWFVIGVIVLLLLVLIELYIRHDHPLFFETIIEEHKNDKALMTSIGGYQSFEYHFNKNQLKEDTLDFRITIMGSEGSIFLTGKAVKNKRSDWVVVKKEMTFKDGF